MARVSKQNLDKAMTKNITSQFTKLVGQLNERNSGQFIDHFFGFEERVMFAKRLAIIIMIHEGASSYEIANGLAVSPTTVGRLLERYDRGEFRFITRQLESKKIDCRGFLEALDTILTLGLPRYNSKDRWRILR